MHVRHPTDNSGPQLTFVLLGLNDTANPPDRICPLEDVCGFGGFHDKQPNQWFRCATMALDVSSAYCLIALRFITPIFLHAGIIHFVLNMLAQLTASAEVRDSHAHRKVDLTTCSG